ncbi:MAG: glycosyltransferase family 2 protein [Ichthyobacteriaceae bacterium]|nr:glycosyltransferase family 2 protein [Ichthyobacteriaceae bacterium]
MFSVIIPTYNRVDLLERAINSVLNQTFKDFEIIVVDDCSPDNTEEWLKNNDNSLITYYRNNTNKGLSYNRNLGVEKSRYKYIAFLDDDDLWLNNHLFELSKMIKDYPNAGLYCNSYTINYGLKKVSAMHDNKYLNNDVTEFKEFKCFTNKNSLCAPSTTAIKKEVFDKLGGFNSETTVLEDIEFYVKIGLNYPIITNRKETILYAQNSGDHLSLNHVHLKNLPDLDKFQEFEKNLPYLKQWLDSIRFQIGMKFLMAGNNKCKYYFNKIDRNNLSFVKSTFLKLNFKLMKLTVNLLK